MITRFFATLRMTTCGDVLHLAPAAFLPIDCKRGRQNGADNFGCKEIFINFRGVRLARYKIFY